MEDAKDQELAGLLTAEVLSIFRECFSFSTFTPVQRHAAKHLLENKDVIVQAPTGSGKTLAYVLPAFTILRRIKMKWSSSEVGCLIIVPTRELAVQVSAVCQQFGDKLEMNIKTLIGGKKINDDVEKLRKDGAVVLVATPGRLEQMLKEDFLKKALKSLEVFIVDEADRLVQLGFKKSVTEILACLPKQRRTGLFSATQAKELEELVKFGLRNALRVTLIDTDTALDSNINDTVLPASLHNYYAVINAEEKLCALVEFIRNHPDAKILVFFSTCSCVEYMKKILTHILKRRQLMAIHGKKRKNREAQLELFRNTPKSVMLSTDVMSRGIDIPDIDWVVQFDVPKQSSWFVHRSGRCGRSGREGNGLLLLTPQQDAYIRFLQNYEKVFLKKMKIPTSNAVKAEQLRMKIIKMSSHDRDILESGSAAFVSFIESYIRHDCNVVCCLDDLDIVGHAHAYGLLRLPRMRELQSRDLSAFKRSDIDTATIAFKDRNREKQRKANIARRKEERLAKQEGEKTADAIKASSRKRKRREETERRKEWEEFADNVALLKKFKKGRLTKKEANENIKC